LSGDELGVEEARCEFAGFGECDRRRTRRLPLVLQCHARSRSKIYDCHIQSNAIDFINHHQQIPFSIREVRTDNGTGASDLYGLTWQQYAR
jgi:hypothetical protein